MKKFLCIAAAFLVLCSFSASAFAADASWSADAAGNWATDANPPWNTAVAPGSAGGTTNTDTATFSNLLTAGRIVTVDADRNINNISFGNTSTFAYTLSGGALSLTNGGTIQTLAGNGDHTDTISSAIAVQGDGGSATLSANATSATSILSIGAITGVSTAGNTTTFTLNGTNTGANVMAGIIGDGAAGGKVALIKDGTGTWTLSAANTYTGNTTITAGILKLGTTNALPFGSGKGNLYVNGTLDLNGFAPPAISGLWGSGTIDNTSGVGTYTLNLGSNNQTSTFAGVIQNTSGTIALKKSGTGTLTLTGVNTYSGDTTIHRGTLKVGVTSAIPTGAGKGNVVFSTPAYAAIFDINGFDVTINGLTLATVAATNQVVNDAVGTSKTLTVGNNDVSSTFAGTIADNTGTGGTLALTKTGSGTLTLSGTNTYTGTTTINEGTLDLTLATAITDTGAVSLADVASATIVFNTDKTIGSLAGGGSTGGNVTLGSNTLTVGDASSTAYGGVMSGTGALTKVGAGTLTLSGTNTYTGTTTINAGTLGLTGGAAIADTGAVSLADVAGATLLLNNNETIGSLAGGGSTGGNVTLGSNTLTVGDANSTTYGGIMSGTGGLTKVGAGTFTFSGSHHSYTGATTINVGTLALTGDTTIGGDIAHTTTSTIDLGSSTLTLDGSGDYTQTNTPTLKTTVNATTAGNIDASSATGTGKMTTLAASTLDITASGYISNGTSWTILDGKASSAGVVVPTTITDDSDILSFAATGGDDLILTATRTRTYNSVAGDSNAAAAGAALEAAGNAGATGDMLTVLTTLDTLSTSETSAALDTLVPEVDAGIINNTTAVLNNFVGVAINRVEKVLTLGKGAYSAQTGLSSGEEGISSGIWGKGYGSYLTQGTRDGIAGYDAWNAGLALGVDRLFSNDFTLGISTGYAYGNVDSAVNNANTNINSAQATIYGGYSDPNLPYFVDAAGTFAWNWYEGQRDINVGSSISRTAKASYEGQQYGVYLGGGYKFNVTEDTEIIPLISLRYNRLHLNSYTETGASSLNLKVDSQDYDQLQSGLGVRMVSSLEQEWGTFVPEIHARWFYDFIGDAMAVTSNFNGGGGSFGSNGAKPALNSFNVGGQLAFDLLNDVSVVGACDTEMKDKFFGVSGSVTVRYNF